MIHFVVNKRKYLSMDFNNYFMSSDWNRKMDWFKLKFHHRFLELELFIESTVT